MWLHRNTGEIVLRETADISSTLHMDLTLFSLMCRCLFVTQFSWEPGSPGSVTQSCAYRHTVACYTPDWQSCFNAESLELHLALPCLPFLSLFLPPFMGRYVPEQVQHGTVLQKQVWNFVLTQLSIYQRSQQALSLAGQADEMVLMVSEIPVWDASLKDLPQSFII